MKSRKILIAAICSIFVIVSCKKDNNTIQTPEPSPTVTTISPQAGPKNTVVTIMGTNFGTNTTALKVFFNGVQGTVQTATTTEITATVPAGAGSGVVKVEKNSAQVNGPIFTYQGNATVTTFSGSIQGFANGAGTSARFDIPIGIVKDAAGNLFVCDRDNHKIRKITPAGMVSTFAGSTMGFAEGTGTAAQFNQPYSITIDASGNLYVGDRINHAIRKITAAGVVTTLAGNGTAGNQNGTGSAARFNEPLGVAADAAGNIFVADYINGLIRKVTPAGVVTTHFNPVHVFGLTIDATGNIYYTTYNDHQVMKYSTANVNTVVAGQGATSGSADGTGAGATFNFPSGITVDNSGNLYVCDAFNYRIRKITSGGVVSTFAGTAPGNSDGVGTNASFGSPLGICPDFGNNAIYVSDFNDHRIRKIIVE